MGRLYVDMATNIATVNFVWSRVVERWNIYPVSGRSPTWFWLERSCVFVIRDRDHSWQMSVNVLYWIQRVGEEKTEGDHLSRLKKWRFWTREDEQSSIRIRSEQSRRNLQAVQGKLLVHTNLGHCATSQVTVTYSYEMNIECGDRWK